jgi:hypothetical protein
MPEEQGEHYIGDGCYASYDGWQICLRAPRENGDHVVYLEPFLLNNLITYARRVGMLPMPTPGSGEGRLVPQHGSGPDNV